MKSIKFLNIFTVFLLVSTLLFIESCHKTAKDLPILTIASPLADDQFTSGQVITIKGEAAGAVRLYALSIKITDDKTGAVLFSNEPYVHDSRSFDLTINDLRINLAA